VPTTASGQRKAPATLQECTRSGLRPVAIRVDEPQSDMTAIIDELLGILKSSHAIGVDLLAQLSRTRPKMLLTC
jgi:hypothetical protein